MSCREKSVEVARSGGRGRTRASELVGAGLAACTVLEDVGRSCSTRRRRRAGNEIVEIIVGESGGERSDEGERGSGSQREEGETHRRDRRGWEEEKGRRAETLRKVKILENKGWNIEWKYGGLL